MNGYPVDMIQQTVTFENCHTPRRFLATAESEFVVPVSAILEIHKYNRGFRTGTIIVTSSGKAEIPDSATGYSLMREMLSETCRDTPCGPSIEHPALVMVSLHCSAVGTLAGPIVVGCILAIVSELTSVEFTWMRSTGSFVLLMFLGGAAGFALPRLAVNIVEQLWGISIALPMTWAVICGLGGFWFADVTTPRDGRDWPVMIGIPLAAAVAGIVLGVVLEKKRRSNNATSDSDTA